MLFIFNRLFNVACWLLWPLVFIRHLMGGTIDAMAAVHFRRFLNDVLVEANCIRILRFIQDSIFSVDSLATTDQVRFPE